MTTQTPRPNATCRFHCEGCGVRVIAIGIERPPAHGFCMTCVRLCEGVPDPEELMRLRTIARQARNRREPADRVVEDHRQ